MAWRDRSWEAGMNRDRVGTPWSADDLLKLKHMIDAGALIPDIARAMGRTQEAIRGQAVKHRWFVTQAGRKGGRKPFNPKIVE